MNKQILRKQTALKIIFWPLLGLLFVYWLTPFLAAMEPLMLYTIVATTLLVSYSTVRASFDPAEYFTPFFDYYMKYDKEEVADLPSIHLRTTAMILMIVIVFVNGLMSLAMHNTFLIAISIVALIVGRLLKQFLSRYFLL